MLLLITKSLVDFNFFSLYLLWLLSVINLPILLKMPIFTNLVRNLLSNCLDIILIELNIMINFLSFIEIILNFIYFTIYLLMIIYLTFWCWLISYAILLFNVVIVLWFDVLELRSVRLILLIFFILDILLILMFVLYIIFKL